MTADRAVMLRAIQRKLAVHDHGLPGLSLYGYEAEAADILSALKPLIAEREEAAQREGREACAQVARNSCHLPPLRQTTLALRAAR